MIVHAPQQVDMGFVYDVYAEKARVVVILVHCGRDDGK